MQKEVSMIGIIAAMDMEVEAIVSLMQAKKHTQHGIDFYEGDLGDKPVVIMKSGVGKGNAAMSTTILMELYDIDAVVNIGTAGGLKAEQQILDMVISKRVVQHDYDTSPIDGEEGVGLYFDADQKMIAYANQVLQDMDVITHQGLIASGDQFIAQEQQLWVLYQRFPDALCAEMEAGAIAQVCHHYQIPFVVLRSLSDVAPQPDSHMDFMEYAKKASRRSAQFTLAYMRIL